MDFRENFPNRFPQNFPNKFPQTFPIGNPQKNLNGFLQNFPNRFPQNFPNGFSTFLGGPEGPFCLAQRDPPLQPKAAALRRR